VADVLSQLAARLCAGDAKAVAQLTLAALDGGLAPSEVLDGGLVTGMDRIGVDFRNGVVFVPEVLVAARAMHAGLDILRPLLAQADVAPTGKVVLGTVVGDLHDVGKKLVGMMLEGAGFNVVYLGIDTPPERFVEAVKNENSDLVGMSALLTTTMPGMKRTIDALARAGVQGSVKIMVGGAPVTQGFAEKIDADGYAPDAAAAAELARSLVGKGGWR
jgi:5-methyltetrahydrofolate--homocysteine methyltransferase